MNYTQGRKTRQIGEWQAWTKSPECQLKPQCIKICDRDNRNNSKYLPDKAPDGTVITGIGAKAFNVPEDKVQQNKFDVDSPYGLSTVVLPESLETIGDQAFEYNNFKTLDLPDTLKAIGISAFHGNKLESLSLPDSVDSIGKGSFSMNSITSLKLPANNPNFTNIPQGAFSMNIRLAHIDLPDTVVTIDDMAFAGARLEELTIPASVKTIGWKAFHLHRITELTINDTATSDYKVAYKGENVMIEGMNGSWTKGSKGGLKFRSSADYHWLFTGRCFVTGITDPGYSHELTEGKDMITSSGSIRVELTDSYLNSLEPGTYQMNIESTVGTATTKFTIGENGSIDTGTPGSSSDDSAGSGSTKVVKTSVKSVVNTGAVRTGDDISVILPAAALAAAVAALVILLAWKNGQRNRKKTEK